MKKVTSIASFLSIFFSIFLIFFFSSPCFHLCLSCFTPTSFPVNNSVLLLSGQRRQWHPTPVLLPGKSHGRRSLQPMGSLKVGHDWVTSLSLFTFMHWRRKWQPIPVFLPGESQERGSLGGLPSMGSHRVGHDRSDLAAAALSGTLFSSFYRRFQLY